MKLEIVRGFLFSLRCVLVLMLALNLDREGKGGSYKAFLGEAGYLFINPRLDSKSFACKVRTEA